MSRFDNLKKRIEKRTKAAEPQKAKMLTEAIISEYEEGLKQQHKGELRAAVVEQFLVHMPEKVRKSFENDVQDMLSLGRGNPKRFRAKVMTCLIIAFQNGTVYGFERGGGLDLTGLIADVAKQIEEKYEP